MEDRFNEAYCESLRKYQVKTDLTVLFQVRHMSKEIGLGGLLKGEMLNPKEALPAILELLADKGKINEFCKIVTGKSELDIMTEEAGTVLWIVNDFFVGWWWSMPPSWRKWMIAKLYMLQEIGKIKLMGLIPTTSSAASE